HHPWRPEEYRWTVRLSRYSCLSSRSSGSSITSSAPPGRHPTTPQWLQAATRISSVCALGHSVASVRRDGAEGANAPLKYLPRESRGPIPPLQRVQAPPERVAARPLPQSPAGGCGRAEHLHDRRAAPAI